MVTQLGFHASGPQSESAARYTFDKMFGAAGISPEEIYYDPLRKVDKRAAIVKQFLAKAPSVSTTTGGTFTDYGLMPAFHDPAIVDRTMRQTPLANLLPRRAISGRSYTYNAVTAKGSAFFGLDDAPLSEVVDTRTTTNVEMKYLYAVGRVTGPALRSGQGFIDLLAEDLRTKQAAMLEALEDQIINGTSADANGFAGLIDTISTNDNDLSGAAISLSEFRESLNASFESNGIVDLAVTDGNTHNVLKGLLMDFQRFIERPGDDMPFGIPDAFLIDGVLVIKDRFMPTTATQRAMLLLDTRYVFLAILQDMAFEELAKTNDSNKFMLKWYGSLVVSHEAACAKITNIA